ncbi:MAG: hydantoinase/oxoprolinase family protein [Actinomycetota bacterium]|nr:hydantoinase/oxoprolinase family protein [Actinomycetota bacterium]
MILGADVGGTFTDLVLVDANAITTVKVLTTAVQSDGIATGAETLAAGTPINLFIHGTTVATNALLEGKGARTALITDVGFEDVIEIARQDRPSLYDSYHDRPRPLVSRDDRIGVDRDFAAVIEIEAEAVAVAFVNGHEEPDRERAILESLREHGFEGPVSLSSVVAPEFREYERTSTTVLNAYLTPSSAHYLASLDATLVESGLVRKMSLMRSSGGLISASDAAALPASILLSGPAGGVIATAAFAGAHGNRRVVSFDMGGTSTDVCRIDEGVFDISYQRTIGGYECRLPSVGIHTVGAGGGSIAWIDAGGSLRVGPQSAGAEPGPACYGKGGSRATVSDANVVLGRIAPDASLGGSVSIDFNSAVAAIEPLAETLGLPIEETAVGIIAIAEDVMGGAIRKVSIEEGTDPRGAHLYAFGGAGGLHATSLARTLGMAGVVIPPHGGVFSALGLLLAPPRSDVAQSVFVTGTDLSQIEGVASALTANASQALADAGHGVDRIELVVDVRYLGQSHEIGVLFGMGDSSEDVAVRFHEAHERRNGFARPDDPVEIVTVRCTAFGRPSLTIDELPQTPARGQAPFTMRTIWGRTGLTQAVVVNRNDLGVGAVITGPTIVEEDEATTFVGEGESGVVAPDGSIEVTW